jgi:hypothetical protein
MCRAAWWATAASSLCFRATSSASSSYCRPRAKPTAATSLCFRATSSASSSYCRPRAKPTAACELTPLLQKAMLTFEFSSLPHIRRAISHRSTGLLPLLMGRLCWALSLRLQTQLCQLLMRNQSCGLKTPSSKMRRSHQRMRSSKRLK